MSSPLENKVDLAIQNIASVLEIPSRIYKDNLPCVINDLNLERSCYFLDDNVIYVKGEDLASIYEESGHFLHECMRSRFSVKALLNKKYGCLNFFFHTVNREAFGYFCQRISGKASNLEIFNTNKLIVDFSESFIEGDLEYEKLINNPSFREMLEFSKNVVDFKETLDLVKKREVHYDNLFVKLKNYFSPEFVDTFVHLAGYNLGNELYEKNDLRLVRSFIKSPSSCGFGNFLNAYSKIKRN